MDYNDNESEGQNLQLTGEDSSKSSSVLRPFALPNFDFDDSIHGHLRFDSLVESDVFLGIPSQEDNHWIEDFSRGSSGIVFSSSAAESCALPRHINVWSEATSTESVELLLKACGQEEMASGENMVEESRPDDKIASSTVPMNSLGVHGNSEEVENGQGSVSPDDGPGDFPMVDQNIGVKYDSTGCTSVPDKTSVLSQFADGKDCELAARSGKLEVAIQASNIDQVETGDLANESLCNQVEENVPVPGSEIVNTESSSQKLSAIARESVNRDDFCDTSLVSSNDVAAYIPASVEEPDDGSNKNDENVSRITVDADNPGSQCPLEVPSLMDSSQEHAVEMELTDSGIGLGVAAKGQSITDGRCNEVIAQDAKPPGGDECATAFSSSGTEKQLASGTNLLDDKSSRFYEEEKSKMGRGIDSTDASPICTNTGPKMDAVTQSLVQHSQDNISPGTNSSFHDPPDTFASSASHNLRNNPPTRDIDDTVKESDTSGSSADATVDGECLAKESIVCGVNDSTLSTPSDKENIEPLVHASPMSPANMETGEQDYHLIEEDVHGMEQGDPSCEKEDLKSFQDKNEVCADKEKEAGLNTTCNASDQNVERAAENQPDDVSVNTEDDNTKLLFPSLKVDESISEIPHNAPSFNAGFDDQRKETESESSKGSKISEESHGPIELACAVVPEGIVPLGSAEPGGLERNDRSISLAETTSIDLLDETSNELGKNMEHTGSAQDDDADIPSEKLMEAKPESSGTISAIIPVTGCTDTIAQVSAPNPGLVGHSESVINVETPLEKKIEKLGEVQTTPSPVTASCQAEESFTFDVRPLGGQSTADTTKGSLPLNAEGVISASGKTHRDNKMAKEISVGDSPVPDGSARKTRRGSSRTGKGSVKKGNQVKESTPIKQNDRDAKSTISSSPFGAGQLVTFGSALKPTGPVFVPTSNLPDLNPSAQSSTIFQQPFTALQQVQLRAQIFVYGSLIQGVAPDEACMVSAFDGAKHAWEPVWRTCVDRLRSQKSQGNNNETPVHLRSGAKGLEESFSGSGQLSNKTTSVVNPVFPLSSPFWSIATPSSEATSSSNAKVRGPLFDHPAVSPLHPFQSPAIRNFTPHSTWPSQNSFPVAWFASSQSSSFGISTNYSSFPITEPVKLTPVKDSSLAISSGAKMLQTTPALHTSGTAMFPVAPSLNSKKVKASSGQTSLDSKSRKRKKSSSNEGITLGTVPTSPVVTASVPMVANYPLNKSSAAADASQISSTRSNVNTLSTPFFNSHYSTSVAVAAPSTFVPSSTPNQLFSVGLPSVSHDLLNRVEQNKDTAASNADGFKKVEEANIQAQEAAAHASQAVNHCESVWKQLKHQMNSGLSVDVEAKLASAAAAVAASACVAKAAAAAANVALSAAVQAKLMAEEAVSKSGTIGTVVQDSISGLVTNYGTSSVQISAAREAARRRIEAASAATRHAENLDAIVKAAELAAEAVSHTGKIVAMGDPFSIHELVEVGPDKYWKVLNTANERGSKTDINKSNTFAIGGVGLKDKVADSSKTASFVPESNLAAVISSDVPYIHPSARSINEGSMVEVFKELGDQKKGWFSANIVSLKDMEAFVCCTELQSNEGSNQLKEWVSLKSNDGEAPRVRIPHPMTSVQFDGTRKRRRAAVKNYTWSVGDKVDAWLEDCWREGVVVEKNMKDTTSVGVRFSAEGSTQVVKVWHLRPTLIWTGEQWSEWCRPQTDGISQGDTPMGKRSKLGNAGVPESINFVETVRSEEARLPLSADEKVFNIGSTSDKSKPAMARTGRSDAVKGSSRVVFGVPKPGKKRKFMEVSKHYVSDRTGKVNVPDDSVKLSKFLTRHGSSRVENISKVDKERQAAGSKAKVPKFGKPPSIPGRTLKQKDGSSSSQANEQNNASDRAPISDDENESGDQKLSELGSANIEEVSGGAMVFSAPALEKDTRKKVLTKGSKSDQQNQGKLLPTSGKVVRNESSEKSTSHVDEPRRSVRRIQPTSRLLEGIQSSLSTPKIPSSSHDKSHRSQNKGTARGSK